MATLLITGASGFIGSHLCGRLIDFGRNNVICTYRSEPRPYADREHGEVSFIKIGSLFDIDASMLRGVDVIVHLAAAAHDVHKKKYSRNDYLKVNAQANKHLAKVAIKAGLKQIIFMSSIGVHGDHSRDVPINEKSPFKPMSDYAFSKLEGEMLLKDTLRGTPLKFTIFRPTMVIGSGAPGNLNRLCKLVALNIPFPFSRAKNRRSLISVNALSTILMDSILNDSYFNEEFVVANQVPCSTKEMVNYLGLGMEKKTYNFYFPHFLVRMATNILGKSALYRQLYESLEVDSTKLISVVGQSSMGNVKQALLETGRAFTKDGNITKC